MKALLMAAIVALQPAEGERVADLFPDDNISSWRLLDAHDGPGYHSEQWQDTRGDQYLVYWDAAGAENVYYRQPKDPPGWELLCSRGAGGKPY